MRISGYDPSLHIFAARFRFHEQHNETKYVSLNMNEKLLKNQINDIQTVVGGENSI